MIRSKIGQRLFGLLFLALGVYLTVAEWQSFLQKQYYYPEAAALGPVAVLSGIGVLLFPIDYTRLEAEHGVTRIRHFRHYPPFWKIWFFVTLLAGLVNWFTMATWN